MKATKLVLTIIIMLRVRPLFLRRVASAGVSKRLQASLPRPTLLDGPTIKRHLTVMANQAKANHFEKPVLGSNDSAASSPSSQTRHVLSGRCLCGALQWTLSPISARLNPRVAQVLVCHCSMCRRVSGSSSVPWAALPRKPIMDSMVSAASSSHLGVYRSSEVASRGFCKTCGSTMYMDYHEDHTLWIPLGAMDSIDIDEILDASRDSQIFLESKAEFTDALNNLPHFKSFGTYRPDPCQPVPFEKLKTWEEHGSIASFVSGAAKNNEGASD